MLSTSIRYDNQYNNNHYTHIVEYNIKIPHEKLKNNHDYNDGILTRNEEIIKAKIIKSSFIFSEEMTGTPRFNEEYDHGYGLAYGDEPVLLLPILLKSEWKIKNKLNNIIKNII